MAWVRGKVPPPGRLPKGIANRFGRPSGSLGDKSLERSMNADTGFDRDERLARERRLTKYGKWHNPRKRVEPPANMEEGWLVETDYPPRRDVEDEEPRPEDGGQDGGDEPNPNDPQDPQKPRQ